MFLWTVFTSLKKLRKPNPAQKLTFFIESPQEDPSTRWGDELRLLVVFKRK